MGEVAILFPDDDSEILSVHLSVRPYPNKRNHLSFVNISPTLAINTSVEKSSKYYSMESQQFDFIFKKGEIEF